MPFLLKTVSLFDILNTEYYNKGELTMDALQQIKDKSVTCAIKCVSLAGLQQTTA